MVTSDARIKKIISGAWDDLGIVNALNPVRFRHSDALRYPGEDGEGHERIGFIAQNVARVLPVATASQTGVVPDIQQVCAFSGSNITFYGSNINAGDVLNLVNADGNIFGFNVHVTEVSASNITIDNYENLTGSNVFVYGHEVNDFLTVNYEPITACTVGAIQRLSQLVEALTARVTALEA